MSFTDNMQNFLAQSDAVGQALLGLLITMSIAGWYFIAVKAWQAMLTRRRTRQFLTAFWNAATLDEVAQILARQKTPADPFSYLTSHAINAARHHAEHGAHRLSDAGSANDFLTRSMRRAIDEETARLEWGLTALASIASTAPFVGLATINQVAGPVGEALIMTGLGLAVAIPAVLAYNDCARSNRLTLAKLDAFAHDLYTFITTGAFASSGAV